MEKNVLGWNLETMLHPESRPAIFRKLTGLTRQPNGCNSYVYKITHIPDGNIYIGYHKESDTVYRTSSKNKVFRDILASGEVGILDYEILFWGSVKECEQKEFELLTAVDAANNPNYYNSWNGKPGVRKLDIKFVNELMKEIDDFRKRQYLRDHSILSVSENITQLSVGTLFNIDRLQIRELQLDTENLHKIMDRIKNDIGTYDMPVILKDITYDGVFYDFLLISGNHTTTAYWKLRNKNVGHTEDTLLDCVIIDEDIHRNLQDNEIDMLGNNLNADFNVGKSFTTRDGVKECLGHYKKGNSWKTQDMRARLMSLGLTSNQVKTVFNTTEDEIKKDNVRKSGMIVYDYVDTHKNKLRQKKEFFELQDSDTFVITSSSGNPHLYRWIESYINEQMYRLSIGKNIQSKIKVVVYHTNYKSKKQWKDLWCQLIRPQNIPHAFEGYLFNNTELSQLTSLFKFPDFSYYEMPMEGASVQKNINNLKQAS